jgi:hypothetical protein
MAALSAVKNQKAAKAREGVEGLAARCQEREGAVGLELLLALLEVAGVEPEPKEMERLAGIRKARAGLPRSSGYTY